jgi:hypothetical protein
MRFRLELVVLAPLNALFFAYYLKLGLRRKSVAQTPEKLFRDRRLMLLAALNLLFFLSLMFTDIPWLYEAFNVDPARTEALWSL